LWWCKARPTCVFGSIELEAEATKTPEIKPFDIINDEQQNEKHAANQFFSSLLVTSRALGKRENLLFSKTCMRCVPFSTNTLLTCEDGLNQSMTL